MRKERDGTYHGDRSNFLSLRVRGKEKSIKREEKKNKKKLDLRKRVKKSKNTTKKRTDGIHVEKKERRTNEERGIEFPHFSNTLKLHALHTHTHNKKTL